MAGPNDWLAALAGNLYGTGTGANPAGLAPGGGAMGYPAASGQGPNMGLPGQGAPASAGMPPGLPQAPQPQPQASPPMFQFGGFHPGNAINPDFYNDMSAAKAKIATLIGAASQGQPTSSADLVGAGDTSLPSTLPQARGVANPAFPAASPAGPGGQGGIGSDARFPLLPNYGSWPGGQTSPPSASPPGSPSAAPVGSPSNTPRPVGALAARAPPRTQPTANPAAAPNSRFGAMPYGTAQRGPGSTPIITAANFGGLFGGQPAAAPAANVPAANAQPVSAAGPPANVTSQAPWNYGPQQGNIGWPSNTPYGPNWPGRAAASLKQRYG